MVTRQLGFLIVILKDGKSINEDDICIHISDCIYQYHYNRYHYLFICPIPNRMEKTKTSHIFPNFQWKRRYIVLDVFQRLFSYYEDEAKTVLKGRVKLTNER